MNFQGVATTYQLYLAEVEHFPLLAPKEELDLALQWRTHHNIEAARRLVTSNLRFVVKVALEYKRYGAPIMDLIQEGNIGLMKAVKKFDPHKGYRLISYAVWWIRAQIQSFILKTWSLVKLGTTQAQRKLFAHRRELATLGSPTESPAQKTVESLAKELNVKNEEVLEMELRLSARDFSLDSQIDGDSQTTTYVEQLADESADPEISLVQVDEQKQIHASIRQAMNVLTPKETQIIEKRLLTEPPRTLQEIGDELKITRERVRQIEEQALKKLRTSPSLSKELLPATLG
ncbi:MAG: RNA polymerase factor sigma-32 [Deltaproteobacteria bacterium]|nr:RNA polymerase factor sigma-32 [Deltaproteobacteria bacterium]